MTKEGARKALREIEDKISKRIFLHEKRVPLFFEVAQQWLEWKKPDVRITTWNWQANVVKKHYGMMNGLRVTQITTAIIEKWFNEMRDQGFKTLTIKHMTIIMGQIMNYAVRHKMIDSNPVREAQRPRKQINEDIKPQILNPEQIKTFLAGINDPQYHALFMTYIFTGARKGEVLP
jgi:site-specific recombinase XerD